MRNWSEDKKHSFVDVDSLAVDFRMHHESRIDSETKSRVLPKTTLLEKDSKSLCLQSLDRSHSLTLQSLDTANTATVFVREITQPEFVQSGYVSAQALSESAQERSMGMLCVRASQHAVRVLPFQCKYMQKYCRILACG